MYLLSVPAQDVTAYFLLKVPLPNEFAVVDELVICTPVSPLPPPVRFFMALNFFVTFYPDSNFPVPACLGRTEFLLLRTRRGVGTVCGLPQPVAT